MNCDETALTFVCGDNLLVGVLARPRRDVPTADTAVIVVAGGPQYRVGSHRQFALLSRALAGAGYPVLRFDARGAGDSGGEPRDFEARDDDITAAIAAVRRQLPGIGRVVLLGLCDGASAALLYLHRRADRAVSGLGLLNPWVRTPAGLARTYIKHYYLRRLAQPDFWHKLLAGAVSPRALRDLAGNLRLAGRRGPAASATSMPFPQAMAAAWRAFSGPILLVLSGDDYTAREFVDHVAMRPEWQGNLDRGNVTRVDLAGANHTFANAFDRQRVASEVLGWLGRVAPLPTGPGSRVVHNGGVL